MAQPANTSIMKHHPDASPSYFEIGGGVRVTYNHDDCTRSHVLIGDKEIFIADEDNEEEAYELAGMLDKVGKAYAQVERHNTLLELRKRCLQSDGSRPEDARRYVVADIDWLIDEIQRARRTHT